MLIMLINNVAASDLFLVNSVLVKPNKHMDD